ncbi:FCD domain-containing protein [Breoghania sp.]|uniref:FadR/GntR family transcriptional regulator n=1 Tax=Breoghania sp. TaxID=2065378 RepID=UPI0026324244|nr:FCD domain-containing protein [Breoghania sp.]MDJ0933505.1 FCD domain-containing protein [Breoghania sp.]
MERLRVILNQFEAEGRDQLPTERELAEEIGVGRRAVRPALEVLEAEDRIWRRQGAGTFIGAALERSDASLRDLAQQTNILEMMEVRLRIEPVLAQLAALRATPPDIAKLRNTTEKLEQAGDSDVRELWDSAIHRTIANMAGNRLFLALFDVIDRVHQDENWRHTREAVRTPDSMRQATQQHRDLVEAISRRDPLAAERAMRRHLTFLQENFLMLNTEAHIDGA